MIQFRAKAKATDLCKWTDLGRSSFYYKPHPGPRGMKPSTQTQKGTLMVDNAVVVEEKELFWDRITACMAITL